MINNSKQKVFGIIFSYLSVGINMIIGVVYTPLLLRNLGQNQYGIYSLCISVVGYLTIINAGANGAYIRYYVQSKDKKQRVADVNGIFFKIFLALSIIAFLGGVIIADYAPVLFGNKISPEEYIVAEKCFRLLSVIVAIEIFTCFYNSLLIANERFYFVKGIAVVSSAIKPLLTIPYLVRGYDCTIILLVRLIVSFVVLILHIIVCNRSIGIPIKIKTHDKRFYFDIFQFIFFIVLQSIFDQLNWQVDKFILARVKGTTEISIYSVGSTLNSYYITIAAAVTSIFIAEVNRNIDNQEKVNEILQRTSKLIGYVVFSIMVAFSFAGDFFIRLWAGKQYSNSFYVAILLMLPITFSLPLGVGQDIARAKNKHQKQIIYNLFVCFINVFVSIPLATRFGAVGSAFGTFLSEIVICWIIQPIYYIKYLDLDVKAVYIKLFRIIPSLIPGTVYLLTARYLNWLSANWYSVIFNIFIFLIMSFSSFLLFTLSNEEKNRVLALFGVGR